MDRNLLHQVNQTSVGQFPFATILSCIDSRTSAELIFDQGLGDIFSIRIAGNVLNRDILGSMEYACHIAGSKLVMVLGHTKCGAIISACNQVCMGSFTRLLMKIAPAIKDEVETLHHRNGDNLDFVNKVSVINVFHTIRQIRMQSSILKSLEKKGAVLIVGGLYNIDNGEVTFFTNA
jgi:carbonic anhydrase